jgi:hypothetical protein
LLEKSSARVVGGAATFTLNAALVGSGERTTTLSACELQPKESEPSATTSVRQSVRGVTPERLVRLAAEGPISGLSASSGASAAAESA